MKLARPALLALALVLLAGCGDPVLWDRWRAERDLYHAARAARRAEAPDAGPAAHAAAERLLDALAREFPASRWGSPPARGPARDVAVAASRAALARARLAAARGDHEEALARWRAALAAWGALPGAVVAARVGAAQALDRLGRGEEALAERRALAALDPLGDPDRSGPAPQVLAAPAAVADELRDLGREAEARDVLLEADARFAAALERAQGRDALAIARALAAVRVARGDGAGALAALRTTFAGLRAWEVPPRAVTLAGVALDAALPDSAIAYARWAASASNSRSVAGPALVLAARAWEAKGLEDSALAAYDALEDRWPDPGAVGPEALFRRARLLQRRGQWESARATFSALVASAPASPFALRAHGLVVRHHLDERQFELARLEGDNAIERLEYLLATNRDPDVQRDAGLARAGLLQDLGRSARAESVLVDLWRRFPEDSATESAALRGASLAEHRPGGRAAAAALYGELARRAASAPVRRAAARRLEALGAAKPPGPEEVRR